MGGYRVIIGVLWGQSGSGSHFGLHRAVVSHNGSRRPIVPWTHVVYRCCQMIKSNIKTAFPVFQPPTCPKS